MVCIRCQKRPAIIFIQRMENGQMKQEGYCLHCARELHIKPVDDLMKQFGMSEQDLDNMENRMESMMEELGDSNPLSMLMNMSGSGEDADAENMDEDLVPGSNATFPLGFTGTEKQDGEKKADRKNGKKPPKRKFLDTYCENLTRKAREGKLDDIIGRDREIYRTIQILSRRQKNNPCLIGEAGVGKTAIAEGLAERIAAADVPEELLDKKGARPMSYQTHGIPQQRSAGQGSSSRGFSKISSQSPARASNSIPSKPAYSFSASSGFSGAGAKKPAAAAQSYSVGETVKHKAYGTGVILSMQKMANDTMLEIAFEKVGTKKIMANYAKLEKV